VASTSEPHEPSRRRILEVAGLAGAGTNVGRAVLARETTARPSQPSFAFLQAREAAFVKAAAARVSPTTNRRS